MLLTDTHAHLYSDAFNDDREEMMQRAFEAGVGRLFLPAIDSEFTDAMLQMEKDYPQQVFLMAGLHPTHVKENYNEELELIEQQLAARKFVAIGEIGMDLYWDKTFVEAQKDAFRRQIQLAKKYHLPIAIHCRNAFDEVFEVLELEKGAGLFGIFHCFTGTLEQAKLAISYNLKLGIGGVVTFKNGKIDQFLNQIHIKHIVLETDAPYLAPKPYRGKRNESSYLLQVAEKISDLYEVSVAEVARITTENSKEVFGM